MLKSKVTQCCHPCWCTLSVGIWNGAYSLCIMTGKGFNQPGEPWNANRLIPSAAAPKAAASS